MSRSDATKFSAQTLHLVYQWKDDVLHMAGSEMLLHRDDCREFVELCTIYLDGQVC